MKKTRPAVASLANAFGHEPADKRIDILRFVGESGSISQAARDAKVSYKAAWQAIDTLTNLAGVELVKRAVGGSGGGGASITPAGQKLLAVAQLLSATRSQVFASFSANELLLPQALPVLSTMSVRSSMRNQLPCRVQKLSVQGQVVRVYLQPIGTTAQSVIVSRITKASVELLDLRKDLNVLAQFKATAVQVQDAQIDNPPLGMQCLTGQVTRIHRSKSGDEVALELDAALQIVGFSAAGSRLKVKMQVQALVDESSVVVALTD